MMKRNSVLLLVLVLALGIGSSLAMATETLKVGASPVPHAEILLHVVPVLAEQGIILEVIEFTDYVIPNLALAQGELDANFFQHGPYLESFAADHRLELSTLVGVHVEPLGIYSNKISDVSELKKGDIVAIPNDVTNGGRALLLLQTAGLIKVDSKAGITPSVFDITENKLGLKFIELEAAQLPRSLGDVTAAVINSNYALPAGLTSSDALLVEHKESPYTNIVAVRTKDLEDANLGKLAEVLQSETVRQFILDNYPDGSVVPAF